VRDSRTKRERAPYQRMPSRGLSDYQFTCQAGRRQASPPASSAASAPLPVPAARGLRLPSPDTKSTTIPPTRTKWFKVACFHGENSGVRIWYNVSVERWCQSGPVVSKPRLGCVTIARTLGSIPCHAIKKSEWLLFNPPSKNFQLTIVN